MYTRLTSSHIRVELAFIRLLAVRNYLNNYFAMSKRMMRYRIRLELTSPAYFELGII